ncbi:NAD(P)/FAD-dependent oxidoreductase [Thiovibrio sp. JS02]
MKKQLVLIGGGHAHLTTLANLHRFVAKGYGVTVIGPSPHHYYSGMGPGMLARVYRPEEIRFATRQVVEKQGAAFVLGRAVRIEPRTRAVHLADGTTRPYDVLSCNAGSSVPQTLPGMATARELFSVKPIERLMEAQARLLALAGQKQIRVAVLGGGPSAVEVAGNVWRLLADARVAPPRITVFAGSGLMARQPEAIRSRARRSLVGRGIEIVTADRVREIREGKVVLASGAAHEADLIFLALGIEPSPLFADSGLATGPDGGLLVNEFLQCPEHPEIFGGGDCIFFAPRPLDKVGVYAVRQNPVLCHNLLAALEGRPLRRFSPGGDYLLIYNLGDGTGILRKRGLVFGGRPAFWLKDFIDRRFMRKFQALEKG